MAENSTGPILGTSTLSGYSAVPDIQSRVSITPRSGPNNGFAYGNQMGLQDNPIHAYHSTEIMPEK
jgi:hypothetical protein